MIKKNIRKIDDYTYFYKEETVSYVMEYAFTYETSKINYLKASILSRYITSINEEYKTKKEIYDRSTELYNLSLTARPSTKKNNSLFFIDVRMIEPKRVNDDYFDDAIKYIKQVMCNLYVVNNKLDKTNLTNIKNRIYNEYINRVKELNYESYVKYLYTVLKDDMYLVEQYSSKEELKELLDSITDKDLIDFYNEVLNNHYKTLLFGNMSNREIDTVLKSLNFKHTNISNIIFNQELTVKNEYNEYSNKNFTQSILTYTYNIKDRDKYSNRVYTAIISVMCNNTDGMFLSLLREKYGLVYSSYIWINPTNGLLTLEANIDKKNKDKTMEVIKEFFKDMHNKKKLEERLIFAKDKIKENVYLSNESPFNRFSKFFDYIFRNEITDREFIKRVNSVEVEDIIDFMDNLENENIFFYIGDKDE